jgi:glycosyltransferase involved in cell wall biosynthesis
MQQPLVSVICLCYNHEQFVREAIESVFRQTYPNLQIIVVDDASTDNSVREIEKTLAATPHVQFLSLKQNLGNCKAFNAGLALAKGEYIIDFATDDRMMPERIEHQVRFFSSFDESYGVNFTDAVYMDAKGKIFRHHYDHLLSKGLIRNIPEGDVYAFVLGTYYIASPTMMVRRRVFEALGGYDETLAYEDFDFWVRSSRAFKYCFLNEQLTGIRRKHASMSTGWYRPGDPQLYSTYKVCKKAQALNRSPEDHQALVKRARYELRQSVFSENHAEAHLFYALLKELRHAGIADRLLFELNKLRLPLSALRNRYHQLRYGTSALPQADLKGDAG